MVHVTEGAEHNLVIAADVSLNASRVSRMIECAEIRLDPSDLFDLQEVQQFFEIQWVGRSSDRTSMTTPRICAALSPTP